MKHKVVIVGAGLFGSIAATLAREEGHQVIVVDDGRALSASRASGCVLAPSWLSSLERAQIDTAMDVLSSLYTVHELEFSTNLIKTFRAKRVDTDKVLVEPNFQKKVLKVTDGAVHLEGGTVLRGRVLVATGVWCNELLGEKLPSIKGLYSASLRAAGKMEEPRIHVYAPYRQAVGFQMSPSKVWFGDGTALIQKTWEKKSQLYVAATTQRAQDFMKIGVKRGLDIRVGIRPYVEDHKAGYFAKVSPSTWVSTGGAKNGTVLAAWQAHRFLKEALK